MPAGKKHRFNQNWMHRHLNDPYVRKAQQKGYRSRAAFKLAEIDDQDKLIKPGMCIVELGAAPGSWTQVVRERLGFASQALWQSHYTRHVADGAPRWGFKPGW